MPVVFSAVRKGGFGYSCLVPATASCGKSVFVHFLCPSRLWWLVVCFLSSRSCVCVGLPVPCCLVLLVVCVFVLPVLRFCSFGLELFPSGRVCLLVV